MGGLFKPAAAEVVRLHPPAGLREGRGGIIVQVISRGESRPHTEQKDAPRMDTNFAPQKTRENREGHR